MVDLSNPSTAVKKRPKQPNTRRFRLGSRHRSARFKARLREEPEEKRKERETEQETA
jgi:hypothetical protein